MKQKTIKIPIYFGKLVLIKTKDLSKLNKIYRTDISDKQYDAVFFKVKEKYVIALKNECHSVIAHEVVHFVNSLFNARHIELDKNNDEPQAYLTGWAINEIYKFLK